MKALFDRFNNGTDDPIAYGKDHWQYMYSSVQREIDRVLQTRVSAARDGETPRQKENRERAAYGLALWNDRAVWLYGNAGEILSAVRCAIEHAEPRLKNVRVEGGEPVGDKGRQVDISGDILWQGAMRKFSHEAIVRI